MKRLYENDSHCLWWGWDGTACTEKLGWDKGAMGGLVKVCHWWIPAGFPMTSLGFRFDPVLMNVMNCSYIWHKPQQGLKAAADYSSSRLVMFLEWLNASWTSFTASETFFTRKHKSFPVNFVLSLFSEIFSHDWQRGTVPVFLTLFLEMNFFTQISNLKWGGEPKFCWGTWGGGDKFRNWYL